jgi:hypothetical protein
MIDPSGCESRNRERECNGEVALPLGHSNHSSEQNERKQNRQNEMAAFEFFDERRTDQENGQRYEKLHRREAIYSKSAHHLLR